MTEEVDGGEYVHILSKEGRCSCGEFEVNPADPSFANLALDHLHDAAVDEVNREQSLTVLKMVAVVAVVLLVVSLTLVIVGGV